MLCASLVTTRAARALGNGPSEPEGDPTEGHVVPETPLAPVGAYHLFGALGLGRGLRFDNPYRLETELGKNAESLSLTATYFDASVGVAIGGAGPVFHGLAVHGSFALDGIVQQVVTPSYVFFFHPDPRWAVLGRAGLPIVVQPDVNAGFEVAGGGVLYLTAAFGLTASVVGSLFFGAATLDTPRTTIPLLSLEGGAFYDYEILP